MSKRCTAVDFYVIYLQPPLPPTFRLTFRELKQTSGGTALFALYGALVYSLVCSVFFFKVIIKNIPYWQKLNGPSLTVIQTNVHGHVCACGVQNCSYRYLGMYFNLH